MLLLYECGYNQDTRLPRLPNRHGWQLKHNRGDTNREAALPVGSASR